MIKLVFILKCEFTYKRRKNTLMESFEIVETQYGPVRGSHKISCLGTDYMSFQGIPYMKAPLGILRFRDPQPPKPWTEPFNATEEPPSYCHFNMMTQEKEGQENAGILNVYTKSLSREKLLPVMVFIHGGAFMRGSSRTDVYGPDYFMEKEVVLITFNYRLGAFGFLSLNDESLGIPGNAGLKDQIFALKWVQENVVNFGGDAENVTVFGESAGGGSIHLLSLIEQSKGLFHRAIVMSGSAFSKSRTLISRSNCLKFAYELAKKLGWNCRKGDDKNLLEFLEVAEPFDIVNETMNLITNEIYFKESALIPFGPCIEAYKSENCLIDKDPILMARDAWSRDVDILFMGCSSEGIMNSHKEEVSKFYFQNSLAFLLPLAELDLTPNDPIAIEYGERLKEIYFKDVQQPSKEQFIEHQGDLLVWHGIYRAIMSRLAYAQGKTFLLRFDVDASLNAYKTLKKCEHIKGASHGDDLFYLFNTNYTKVPSKDSKEFKVIEKMIGIFTNFATNGSPNCREIEPIAFTPQTNADQLKCVQITENDVTEIFLPELSKLRVWNSIYDDHDVALY